MVAQGHSDDDFLVQRIQACADRDLVWAEYIVNRVLASDDDGEEPLQMLLRLRESLRVLQFEGEFLDVREPLLLREADRLMLAWRLAERYGDYQVGRGFEWMYKDSFVEVMIHLAKRDMGDDDRDGS